MKHIERYFKRRGIAADHILYAYRNERNLVIRMDSGDAISCSMLLRELTEYIPMEEFITIRSQDNTKAICRYCSLFTPVQA